MIELKGIVKEYSPRKRVIDSIDLKVEKGEFVVLVGESGCGKSTTLKMINKLTLPTEGNIEIKGQDIRDIRGTALRRRIGYVIQSIGLFPHFTIEQNIALVPGIQGKSKRQTHQRVEELMETIGLPHKEYAKEYPHRLSGGQRQRVGVARALAGDPDIILMDEPFSALDPINREQLQDEILSIQEHFHKTIVFVTHDIGEALKLGDRIAVMQNGRILQYDSPGEILKNPTSSFIEDFVGRDRLWQTPEYLTAQDVMCDEIPSTSGKQNILQGLERMRKHRTSFLLILGEGTAIQGIVQKPQLAALRGEKKSLQEVMDQNMLTVSKDTPLAEILKLRQAKGIKYTLVTEDNKVIGMIANSSIMDTLAEIIPAAKE